MSILTSQSSTRRRAAADRSGGPPPDERLWSGPLLGFLAAVVLGVPVLLAVLLLTQFGVLEETKRDASAGVVSEAAQSTQAAGAGAEVLSASSVFGGSVLDAPPADKSGAEVAADPADAGSQLGQVYAVVAGDVLHQIALRFGVTTRAMAVYNTLTNPNALRIGQELRIPPPGYQPPTEEELADSEVESPLGPLIPGG